MQTANRKKEERPIWPPLILITLLLVIHLAGHTQDQILHHGSPWYTAWTYQAIHVTWIHLALNSWAILGLWYYYQPTTIQVTGSILCAGIVGHLWIHLDITRDLSPVAGASAAIYALIGTRLSLRHHWRRSALLLLTPALALPLVAHPRPIITTLVIHAASYTISRIYYTIKI